MTIGPDPMISTDSRSLRRGMAHVYRGVPGAGSGLTSDPGYPRGMRLAAPRRPLRGIELTRHRRHVRWMLIALIGVGAALAMVGFGFGSFRVLQESGRGALAWSEWHS